MGVEFSTNADCSELGSVELDVNQWPEQPLHLYSNSGKGSEAERQNRPIELL
jgi:hypothetical protein